MLTFEGYDNSSTNSNAESADSSSNFVIVSQLPISNMFNIYLLSTIAWLRADSFGAVSNVTSVLHIQNVILCLHWSNLEFSKVCEGLELTKFHNIIDEKIALRSKGPYPTPILIGSAISSADSNTQSPILAPILL